jgi:hypothetical protein
VIRTWIYQENAEWTTSGSGTINFNSTASPLEGTKSVDGTLVTNNQFLRFQGPTAFNVNTYDTLYLYVKPKAAWGTRYLRLNWETSGGNRKGNYVSLSNGAFSFNTSSAAYQLVAIPITLFGVSASQLIQALRITEISASGSIGFYVDNVALQIGVSQPGETTVPNATTTVHGIVELAENGETLEGVVVQGYDYRLALGAAGTNAAAQALGVAQEALYIAEAGTNAGLHGVSAAATSEILNRIAVERGSLLYRDTSQWAGLSPSATVGRPLVSSGSGANPAYGAIPVVDNIVLGQSTLVYSGTTTFDFDGSAYQNMSLTGNLTLAGTHMGIGKSITIELLADNSDRTLAYDANWVVFGSSVTTVVANKRVAITLKCNGTTAASVRGIAVSQV